MLTRCLTLPLHHESASNWSRCALSTVDRSGARLCANTKTKDEAGREEIGPGISDTFPHRSHGGDQAGDPDGTTATDEAVDWFSEP